MSETGAQSEEVQSLGDAPLRFELLKSDGKSAARLGRVITRHGSFDTPAFMTVGTQGTIKGVLPDQIKAAGCQIILANTYHLMLRPGEKTVAALGDLHALMSWSGPILTDSGGFQVISLADLNQVSDAGVTFKSHIDGRMIFLDAARSIAVQNDLGADIIMAFDQCAPADATKEGHAQAVQRTLQWAKECQRAHQRPRDQALFGIVQGGVHADLRLQCAAELVAMDLPGYAMGGLAVGEGFEAMKKILGETVQALPAQKPRYLMGVGFPRDIVAAVARGIDMFDCVLPTRNGRNAYAFTAGGAIRLRNAVHASDRGPIEAGCDCYACRHFSRGAIRHFFFAGEMLGPVLVSVHNVRFYQRLMEDLRRSIGAGTLEAFLADDPRSRLGGGGDEAVGEVAPADARGDVKDY